MALDKQKMEHTKEQFVSTTIDEDEELTGENCPVCGYPIVLEHGLEVCYYCGWSKDDEGVNETEGYYEE